MAKRRRSRKRRTQSKRNIPAQKTHPITDKPSIWRRLYNSKVVRFFVISAPIALIMYIVQGKATSGILQFIDLYPRVNISTEIPKNGKIINTKFIVKNEGKVYLNNAKTTMRLFTIIDSSNSIFLPYEQEIALFTSAFSSAGTIPPGDTKTDLPLTYFSPAILEMVAVCINVSFDSYFGFLKEIQQSGFVVDTRSGKGLIPEWIKTSCDSAKAFAEQEKQRRDKILKKP